MEFLIEASDLKPALQKLRHAVAKNSQTVILNHVSLRTLDASTLQLTATDQAVEMIVNVPAQIQHEGNWALHADQLQKVLAAAPDGSQVEMAMLENNDHIRIRYGEGEFELPCLHGEDMPHMQLSDESWSVQMAGAEMQELLTVSVFAATAKESHRAYLQGVSLVGDIEPAGSSKLRGYASNGHWAGRIISDVSTPSNWHNLIIPVKSCSQITDLVKDVAQITVIGMDRLLIIECGSYTYITKLVQGDVIDFERVFPKEVNHTITINRSNFQSNIKALTALASDDARTIHIHPQHDQLALCLSERAAARGRVRVSARAEDIGYQFGINGNYASGVCDQFEKSEIDIGLSGPEAVMRFTTKDCRLTASVMPIKISAGSAS